MPYPENLNPNFDSISPDRLDDVIAHGLTPSGLPGNHTEKYYVENHPYLLVRHNSYSEPIETIRRTSTAFSELSSFGISALPYIPVEHNDSTYVVTLRVDGESLDDVIDRGASEEMVLRIDKLWANLARYLQSRKQCRKPFIEDIYSPEQYMFGTVLDESEPQLWLVDLGEWSTDFKDASEYEGVGDHWYYQYEGEMYDMVNRVLSLERSLGQTLTNSRAALVEAIQASEIEYYAEKALAALAHSKPLETP